MNEAKVRYIAYKALLEGEINQSQYDLINEVGFVKQLGFGLGNLFKAIKSTSGTLKSTFDDNQFDSVKDAASAQMKKLVAQINALGKKYNKDPEEMLGVFAAILKGAMEEAGIADPRALFQALEKGAPELADSTEKSGKEVSKGETVTLKTLAASPELAKSLAVDIGDKAAAKEIEDAEKAGKEISVEVVLRMLAASGRFDTGKFNKVFKALSDSDRIIVAKPPVAERKFMKHSGDSLLERWQSLAGLRLLDEGAATDVFVKRLEDGEVKNIAGVKTALDNIKDDKEALKDISDNKGAIVKAALNSPNNASLQAIKNTMEDKLKEYLGAGEKAGAGKSSDADEDNMKKLKPVIDDVRKSVKPEEVSDEELMNIMKFIHDLEFLDINPRA